VLQQFDQSYRRPCRIACGSAPFGMRVIVSLRYCKRFAAQRLSCLCQEGLLCGVYLWDIRQRSAWGGGISVFEMRRHVCRGYCLHWSRHGSKGERRGGRVDDETRASLISRYPSGLINQSLRRSVLPQHCYASELWTPSRSPAFDTASRRSQQNIHLSSWDLYFIVIKPKLNFQIAFHSPIGKSNGPSHCNDRRS
jgi:hypothetical protein